MRRKPKRRDPDLFDDDPAYRMARRDDPSTSFEAARKALAKLTARQIEVLEFYAAAGEPTPSEDLEDFYRNHGSSYRARLPELEDAGDVERVKGWYAMRKGTRRECWRITPPGRERLAKARGL